MGATPSSASFGNSLKPEDAFASVGDAHDDARGYSKEVIVVSVKRDTGDRNCELDCENQEHKRQRLHSAQLLGNILSGEDSSEVWDSEASTEPSEDFVTMPSTPTRSRCCSSSSVKRRSDPCIGLANQCAELQQDFVGCGRREEWLISDVDAGSAKLRDGRYLWWQILILYAFCTRMTLMSSSVKA
eukprot:TRINITY_DN36165_c0_g1_i1.p1 TRINITY_DN36165_c0_g1~~TRINITY_DN36165_c0_g1_i1.p1  ORF type:complete len:186 (+),score=25.48 TRINITY_DN36165_c0_g1_i1:99-656(+)